MKGLKLPLFIAAVAIVLAATAWILFPTGIDPANASMAEYQIEKLTCGSCVSNIKSALATVDGVSDVDVNLTSNRGRVIFDAAVIDSAAIAGAITAAGYPATLRLELDPGQYVALQQEQEQLGQDYLARVGDRLLARQDFERLVKQYTPAGTTVEQTDQLVKSLWKDVLQRELLLAAAEQNSVVIQEGEIDARLDELRKGHQDLDRLVNEKFGSLDAFRARLREDMIINRNIEDNVYAGENDPRLRQDKLQAWYADLQKNTEVIIFDPRLKATAQGGGCACCNS